MNDNSVNWVRLDKDDGMVPVIKLIENPKYPNFFRLDNDEGILPVNKLLKNDR